LVPKAKPSLGKDGDNPEKGRKKVKITGRDIRTIKKKRTWKIEAERTKSFI